MVSFSPLKNSLAFRLILLMGIVSLFGDIIYEGARSITGPYLLFLGASAFAVAFIAGFGEFIGYAARLVSGYFADRTQSYWIFVITGYLLIGAIPLLVFADAWEVAAVLIIIERLGKGIRSPAKDTILSHASRQVGRGWGFGIHEALDQIGAVLGPLIFAASIAASGGYKKGLLSLHCRLSCSLQRSSWHTGMSPTRCVLEASETSDNPVEPGQLPRLMLPYGTFTVLTMAGFAVFPLIAYHFSAASVVPDAQIPLFYAIAMAADAFFALVIGRLYDRQGISVLVVVPLVNIPIAFLVFSSGYYFALTGAILWGLSMGAQETILRAALADLTSIKKRGTAYGIFNTLYGTAWFAGSLILGWLYEMHLQALILFSVLMQLAALGAFVWLRKSAGSPWTGTE